MDRQPFIANCHLDPESATMPSSFLSPMKIIRPSFVPSTLCLAILLTLTMTSCSSDDTEGLRYRLDRRNEKYEDYNERRRMKLRARQERTNMWFDRVMGN